MGVGVESEWAVVWRVTVGCGVGWRVTVGCGGGVESDCGVWRWGGVTVGCGDGVESDWGVAVQVFWACGALLEVLLAALVMPVMGWRWLFAFTALPVFLACVCCLVSLCALCLLSGESLCSLSAVW